MWSPPRSAIEFGRLRRQWHHGSDETRGSIMRRQLCSLLLLGAFLAQTADAVEQPPKPGSCPRALKPLPRSVNASVDRIVKGITPQWRDELLKTKRGELVQYQTNWGKGIRDSLCLMAGGNDQ